MKRKKKRESERKKKYRFFFIVIVIVTAALRYCLGLLFVLSTVCFSPIITPFFVFIARAMKRKGMCFGIGIGIRYYDRALREI